MKVIDNNSENVWIILHGWLSYRYTHKNCQMETLGDSVIYPKGGWLSWNTRSVSNQMRDIKQALDGLGGPPNIYLAGNSDGATWLAYLARMFYPLTQYKIKGMCFYGGLYPKSLMPIDKPNSKYMFGLGITDRFNKIANDMQRAAEDTGSKCFLFQGGHRWSNKNNKLIKDYLQGDYYPLDAKDVRYNYA